VQVRKIASRQGPWFFAVRRRYFFAQYASMASPTRNFLSCNGSANVNYVTLIAPIGSEYW